MKFFILATFFTASVMAVPTEDHGSSYKPCHSTLFSNALCCATDTLGVIGLDCDVPSDVPHDAHHFKSTCAKVGQQAKCCVLPVADQALLCDDPIGL